MPGFFSYMKAIKNCAKELLDVGRDYAVRFKAGDMDSKEYENDMVGKIYEITNKYANGDEELEKHLRQHFADKAVQSLKDGIKAYEENIKGTELAVNEISPDEVSENPEIPQKTDKFNEEVHEASISAEERKNITIANNLIKDLEILL